MMMVVVGLLSSISLLCVCEPDIKCHTKGILGKFYNQLYRTGLPPYCQLNPSLSVCVYVCVYLPIHIFATGNAATVMIMILKGQPTCSEACGVYSWSTHRKLAKFLMTFEFGPFDRIAHSSSR